MSEDRHCAQPRPYKHIASTLGYFIRLMAEKRIAVVM